MASLAEFITKYGVRGACYCGRCADAPPNTEQHQPLAEHSVDLTFFRVTDETKKQMAGMGMVVLQAGGTE